MSDLRRRLIERAEHNDEIEESTTAELLREAEAAIAEAQRERDEKTGALVAADREISRLLDRIIRTQDSISQAATASLVWDKREPGVPGYYWIRSEGSPGMTLDWVHPIQRYPGKEFAGPIPVPVEPSQPPRQPL